MNNTRRKELSKIIEELQELNERIEVVAEEEEEAFENIPENLQQSERYEKAEQACEYLAEARDGIEEVISNMEEAIS